MIIIERKIRGCRCNLLTVLDKFLYTSDTGEGRCHRANAPCTYGLCMLGQSPALAQAATADVNNHLKILWCHLHPPFSQLHSLFRGEHIALARRAIDKNTLQSVFLKHCAIGSNGLQIDVAIWVHGCKGGINQSYNLFHLFRFYFVNN